MSNTMDGTLYEVFRCAGCALLSAQFMEKELAFLLLIPRLKKLGTFPSEGEIHEAIDKLDHMTLGQLIRQLKAFGDIGELSAKLQDALEKRNHLAHHFFQAYCNKLDDSGAQEAMKGELLNIKRLFDEMFDGLHHVNFRLMREMGICTENGELVPED
jgi:hypothetical protein